MVYYPYWWEFLTLVAVVVQLIAAGHVIKSFWTRNNEVVPTSVAFLMLVGAVATYFSVAMVFHSTTAEFRQLTVLFWCLIFGLAPMFYFSYTLANAFAVRTIDRISPFSAQIEDPSEFSEARRMALRGDIDGAVSMYNRYSANGAQAMFEAARLLKSVDRYPEAVRLFDDIAHEYREEPDVWAEASYQKAKTFELHLADLPTAMNLLLMVATEAPDTRFGKMAQQDLRRLEAFAGPVVVAAAATAPDGAAAGIADPFYRTGDRRKSIETAYHKTTAADTEAPIPEADPFLAQRRRVAELSAMQASETGNNNNHKRPAKAKPRAKAAAKPKPAKPAASPKKKAPSRRKSPDGQ